MSPAILYLFLFVIVTYGSARADLGDHKIIAEVNNDGTVNMRDIHIAILKFNKH